MRFGLFGGARTDPGEQASDSRIYSDYIDYICEAEELGFHSVFLVEHHFTGFGQVSATLNFLTYLAAKTTKMRLGTAVLVLPWHNPALLASRQILALRGCGHRTGAGAKAASTILDRRGQPQLDPLCRRARLQSLVGPGRRAGHRRRRRLDLSPCRRGAGWRVRYVHGRADPRAAHRDERKRARGGAGAPREVHGAGRGIVVVPDRRVADVGAAAQANDRR